MATRECMYDCTYPAVAGKRKCVWHGLLAKPIEEQIEAAEHRRLCADELLEMDAAEPRKTVPKAQWPDGERFCSGCQGFVPLFYCTGSRCKAHNALAAHSGRLMTDYGITREDYIDLLALQGGVCYVCGQAPKTKRLATDHDHKTGEVRGLLCADMERGCNKAVLGSLEARAVDSALEAARRLVAYLEKTPYERLKEERDGNIRPEAIPDTGAAGSREGAEDRSRTSEDASPDPLRAGPPDWV